MIQGSLSMWQVVPRHLDIEFCKSMEKVMLFQILDYIHYFPLESYNSFFTKKNKIIM